LFITLKEGVVLDDALKTTIRQAIRQHVSPHHIPDEIVAVPEIPHTLNGKKLEVPIKKLLMGVPIEQAVNIDAMANPQSIQFFIEFADTVQAQQAQAAG
jgi:acetoacetyl-CoA synthetase